MYLSAPLLVSIICFTHVQMGVFLVKTDGGQTSHGSKMKIDEVQEEYRSDYFLPPRTFPAARPPSPIPMRRRGGTFGNCFAGGGCVTSVPFPIQVTVPNIRVG